MRLSRIVFVYFCKMMANPNIKPNKKATRLKLKKDPRTIITRSKLAQLMQLTLQEHVLDFLRATILLSVKFICSEADRNIYQLVHLESSLVLVILLANKVQV